VPDRKTIDSYTCLSIFPGAVRIINNCFLFGGNFLSILAFWDYDFEEDSEIISNGMLFDKGYTVGWSGQISDCVY
jgi:hypothetical protein